MQLLHLLLNVFHENHIGYYLILIFISLNEMKSLLYTTIPSILEIEGNNDIGL